MTEFMLHFKPFKSSRVRPYGSNILYVAAELLLTLI